MARTGDLKKSRKILQTLTKSYPNNADIYELKGNIALAENQPEKAIALFQEALKYRNTNSTTIKLAMAQVNSGNSNAAYVTLSNWLKKFPEDVLTLTALADLYLAHGRLHEAQQQYTEIIRIQANNINALNNLAWVLAEQGSLDRALVHAEKAHNMAPENPQLADTYASILLRSGKVDQSLKLLQAAVKKAPKDPNIRFHLIEAQVQAHALDDARAQLEDLLANYPQFAERKKALELLEKLKSN